VVAKLLCRTSETRHVVEKTLRLSQKLDRRSARHIVFRGLRNGGGNDLGRGLKRGIEECLVGLQLLPGIERAACGGDREQRQDTNDRIAYPRPSPALAFRPTKHLVGAQPDQPGDNLGKRQLASVAAITQIGGQYTIALPDLWRQRRREAFPIRVPGLTRNDQWDQWAVRMSQCKEANLFVDRIALRSGRRGDQDQRGRVVEGSDGLGCQRATRIEIVPVTKDRAQLLGDRSHRRFAADQIFANAKALKPPVQPLGRAGVAMAIGKERPIFEGYRRCHGGVRGVALWSAYSSTITLHREDYDACGPVPFR